MFEKMKAKFFKKIEVTETMHHFYKEDGGKNYVKTWQFNSISEAATWITQQRFAYERIPVPELKVISHTPGDLTIVGNKWKLVFRVIWKA